MGFFNKDKAMEAAAQTEETKAAELEEREDAEDEESNITSLEERKKGRKPFAYWEVGGKTLKGKLKTAGITELEQKYKTNLMNIMGSGNGGMPALSVMLDVAYVAMKDFNHGLKKTEMNNIFDKYVEEGGSQLSFYTSVYMEIFSVSGFFSQNLTDQMQETLEETKDIL